MLELPPLSLYLHIPWCVRKCPYCDFNSHQSGAELPEADYVKAILEDLRRSLPLVQGRRLQSIFIGGGTPSLFQPGAFDTLLRAFEKQIGFEPDIEITMEANPGTFEQRRFLGYRSAGINRLSIGIQSFSDLHLQQLGRIHGREEALCAVAMARQAGFDNINLDLMHGLPGQTPMDASQDLMTAMDLDPEHLSWYQLTIEPNTEFYSRPPVLPEDDALADIQQHGERLLRNGGYRQYEVSAYASRPQRRSRHNLNYWTFGDYLGLGAGAHGKITLPDQGHILRFNKTRLPRHYLEHMAAQDGGADGGAKTIKQDDLPLEYMMNCLRLVEGTDLKLFEPRTGLKLARIASPLKILQNQGLISTEGDMLRTTETGQRYLNQVLESFVNL
ncbi:radical SAM family heme chaperone HemW [Pseudomaricurvus alkylphenolicus]|jgi:oxygen-independent coproporphyrinogen-3 oxidase|uniref:radical SAM family heme chaperone HemW n=1 Tax=Pseudomaricurvus alkylphenolicus TaxID=1306991 RepID=UPI00141F3322|nr:radical SAM family heme chaperone HemW [Pseudomaricurvus alkylphenolicus]NIB39391.1 radical SAM family heme chaperone HemW [Pseudomaricurvus alkylphenolicus]